MWPFNRKKPKTGPTDGQRSLEELVTIVREPGRVGAVETVVLHGAMTGAESKRVSEMLRRRMGLEPSNKSRPE